MRAAADGRHIRLREFSRTITQSMSPGCTLRSGLVMPGRTRVGRMLAYWSKPWQMAAAGPTA